MEKPPLPPQAQRLAQAISASGLSGAEICRRIGVTNEQNLTNWKKRGPPARLLTVIADTLNVSRQWLETGEGPVEARAQQDPASEAVEVGSALPLRKGRMPVLGHAQLGDGGYFEIMDYPPGHGDGYLNVNSNDPDAYALKVSGHSMRPRIKDGEYVSVEPNTEPCPGDEVLVRTKDGRAMIKEFMYYRDGVYRFDSINQAVEPIFISDQDILLIHFVGGVYKRHHYSHE